MSAFSSLFSKKAQETPIIKNDNKFEVLAKSPMTTFNTFFKKPDTNNEIDILMDKYNKKEPEKKKEKTAPKENVVFMDLESLKKSSGLILDESLEKLISDEKEETPNEFVGDINSDELFPSLGSVRSSPKEIKFKRTVKHEEEAEEKIEKLGIIISYEKLTESRSHIYLVWMKLDFDVKTHNNLLSRQQIKEYIDDFRNIGFVASALENDSSFEIDDIDESSDLDISLIRESFDDEYPLDHIINKIFKKYSRGISECCINIFLDEYNNIRLLSMYNQLKKIDERYIFNLIGEDKEYGEDRTKISPLDSFNIIRLIKCVGYDLKFDENEYFRENDSFVKSMINDIKNDKYWIRFTAERLNWNVNIFIDEENERENYNPQIVSSVVKITKIMKSRHLIEKEDNVVYDNIIRKLSFEHVRNSPQAINSWLKERAYSDSGIDYNYEKVDSLWRKLKSLDTENVINEDATKDFAKMCYKYKD